jgi:phosphoenolpyruvate carboxykinase (ATP)
MFKKILSFQTPFSNVIRRSFSATAKNIAAKLSFKGHLKVLGLCPRTILRNPTVDTIITLGLSTNPANPHTKKTTISSKGALVAYSHHGTGRIPAAKRIVEEDYSKDDIWWGKINMRLPEKSFKIQRKTAIDYINNQPIMFVIDGYGGHHKTNRYKVRVFCTRPYHALFMKNMLIRPT